MYVPVLEYVTDSILLPAVCRPNKECNKFIEHTLVEVVTNVNCISLRPAVYAFIVMCSDLVNILLTSLSDPTLLALPCTHHTCAK